MQILIISSRIWTDNTNTRIFSSNVDILTLDVDTLWNGSIYELCPVISKEEYMNIPYTPGYDENYIIKYTLQELAKASKVPPLLSRSNGGVESIEDYKKRTNIKIIINLNTVKNKFTY